MRKFHWGSLFSSIAHGLSQAVSTVGSGIETAAKAVGSGVETAAKDVAKATVDVAEAGGKALVNTAEHTVDAIQDLGHGDVPDAVNQGLGAAGLPHAPDDPLDIPTLPNGMPDWPAAILMGQNGTLKPHTIPLSAYMAETASRFAELGLTFGPEQSEKARATAIAYPWIDPSR